MASPSFLETVEHCSIAITIEVEDEGERGEEIERNRRRSDVDRTIRIEIEDNIAIIRSYAKNRTSFRSKNFFLFSHSKKRIMVSFTFEDRLSDESTFKIDTQSVEIMTRVGRNQYFTNLITLTKER